jgi:hypothetical protein
MTTSNEFENSGRKLIITIEGLKSFDKRFVSNRPMERIPEYQDIVHMQLILTTGTKDPETHNPTHSVTGFAYIGIQASHISYTKDNLWLFVSINSRRTVYVPV